MRGKRNGKEVGQKVVTKGREITAQSYNCLSYYITPKLKNADLNNKTNSFHSCYLHNIFIFVRFCSIMSARSDNVFIFVIFRTENVLFSNLPIFSFAFDSLQFIYIDKSDKANDKPIYGLKLDPKIVDYLKEQILVNHRDCSLEFTDYDLQECV